MRKPKTKREIYKTAISQLGRKILKDEKIDENGHDNTGFLVLYPNHTKIFLKIKLSKLIGTNLRKKKL